MTTYPLDFHRRSEQKWVLRAQASSACERTPRAALVGGSQRGQRTPGESERRERLAHRWLRGRNACLSIVCSALHRTATRRSCGTSRLFCALPSQQLVEAPMRWLSWCLAGITLLTLVPNAQAQFREQRPLVGWRTFEVPDFGRASSIQRASSLRPASPKKVLDSGSSVLTGALPCPFTLVPTMAAKTPQPT
jgi:hypothetical protein